MNNGPNVHLCSDVSLALSFLIILPIVSQLLLLLGLCISLHKYCFFVYSPTLFSSVPSVLSIYCFSHNVPFTTSCPW